MNEVVAGLDFGSNTVGYLVARRDGDDWQELERASRFVRLGEGLARAGLLAAAAVTRALDWTREMAARCDALGVERRRAVGTEALRRAANAGEFCRRAEEILGTPLQVIDGEEEARLTHAGVRLRYPTGPLAVLDIGGGSAELVASSRADAPPVAVSVRAGAVLLTERCGEDRLRLRAAVSRVLGEETLDARGARWLTVTGGTGANLAMMDRGQRVLEDTDVEGHRVERDRLRQLLEQACRLTPEQRVERLGIPGPRADILVAGLVLVDELLGRLGLDVVQATRLGLRHGLIGTLTT